MIIMAKMTKETMMKKLGALEDKLFDLIPESEKGTSRVSVLDKVSEIVSGNVKATLAEMTEAFNEGTSLLAVEAEVKKQSKSSDTSKVNEKSDDEKAEESSKKKVIKKKTSKNSEESKELAPVDGKDNKHVKKSDKKEEKFEFPEVLETEEDGNFSMTKIRGLQDIKVDDLLACQWTKEDLAEYEYDEIGVFGKPKEFEKDIDVLVVVDVFEDKIVYASSLGTHKMYHFLKEDVKDMNSNGMPWRVYKPVA